MSQKLPMLSIVTPSYNRAHLLPACYRSLCSQTNMDFEWIIVDDGSTDNTSEVVSAFSRDQFSIVYVKKGNGGKHTALNASHPHIHGKYVLILDSDDYLSDDAVAAVCRSWEIHKDNPEMGLVVFLKGHSEDKPVCTVRDFDVPVDILRYRRISFTGSDCCEVIRTELFLKYPFPVFKGEWFLSEGALWCRVALTHKCVYINKVIYLCEYLEDGLTKSGKAMRIRNPLGGMYSSELCMQRKNYLLQRIKKGLLYCCYGFFAGKKARDILKEAKYKLLTALCLVPGYIIYRYWKKKYS